MLTRRALLSRAAGAALASVGCSSRTTNGSLSSTNPTEPGGCSGIEETSTPAGIENHTHTVCISAADLQSPPVRGVLYKTSVVFAHAHDVVLSEPQLAAILAGQTVTVQTSTSQAHAHAFTIRKA